MIYSFLKAYMFSKKAGSHVKKMAWISLVGIFVGSFSLVLVLSVMSGFNRSIESRLLKHEPHLVVKFNEDKSSVESLKKYFRPSDRLQMYESQDLILKSINGSLGGAEALGLEEEALKKTLGLYFDEEMISDILETMKKENGIVVGFEAANQIGAIIGDQLQVIKPESILSSLGEALSIKTVNVSGTLMTEQGDRDATLLIYLKGGLFGPESKSYESGLEVYLNDSQTYKKVQDELIKDGYEVESWKQRNSGMFLALKLEKLAMTLLLGLALLITSFSIMTLLILIVVQKQKDIGLLLSLGMPKYKVRLLFGGMGCLLALMGLSFGVGFGSLVAGLLKIFPLKIMPDMYADQHIPSDITVSMVLWIVLFCILVSVLSSIVPILKLSNVNLVAALKGNNKL